MTTQKKIADTSAYGDIKARLAEFRNVDAADPSARTRVVVDLLKAVKALGRVAGGAHVSAQSAVLFYMRANVGRVVSGAELEVVSGISEYGRRLRELRSMGWQIVCGAKSLDARTLRALKRRGITEPLSRTDYVLLSSRLPSKRAAKA